MIDFIIPFTVDVLKQLLVGILAFVFGMYVFNKYLLPKIVVKQAGDLIKNAMKDPNLSPNIDKFKKIIDDIEPLVAKIKEVDVEQIVADIKPFVSALKRIDPEELNGVLTSVKDFISTAKHAIEVHEEIPAPPEDGQ